MTPARHTCSPYNHSIHQIYLTYCFKYLTNGPIHVNVTLITYPRNEVEVRWILSDGHVDLEMNPYTKYSYPITYYKWEIPITKKLNFFSSSHWTMKISRGQWSYDRRKVHDIRYLHTRYEASKSSTFWNIKLYTNSLRHRRIVILMSNYAT